MSDNKANAKERVDEAVRVEISQDKMLGVISFTEPENGGKMLTYEQISRNMKDSGVVSGINKELIEELVSNKQYNHKYLVARGKPPINGKDGTLELFFNTDEEEIASLRPKENEDGSVDFKNLDLIQTIQKDQILAKITPPTSGESGENVLGKEIRPVKGKVARLPKGKNIYTSEDGLSLYSGIEGQLIYELGRINISETYVVDGDAGVATGDIDFMGNVIIKGNVESGFTIKAGGNVEVQGFVEEATIIAGNDILLRHGIQGKDRGKLVAGGNIVAKFIQNSKVETRGNLYTEAIMHSHIEAGDSVIVEISKGLIVGGTVQATNLISAKIIGSPMSTTTTVKISMALSMQHRYNEVKADLTKKAQQLEQVEKNIAFIHDKLAKGEPIPKARLERVKPMIALQKQLSTEIGNLQEEYTSLSATLKDYQEGAIRVSDIMYPGCKIVMGTLVKHIREDMKYTRFYISDGDIKVDAFS